MIDPIYSIVFTTALLGSGHCIGMCGPIVAALSLAKPGREHGMLFHFFYNVGRLTTYIVIGVVAGWVGSLLSTSQTFSSVAQGLLLLADLFVIVIGLRTSGMFQRLTFIHLEIPGSVGFMTRIVNHLHTLPSAMASFPIGLVMGFLPCGFLYAIALAAAGRGDPVTGGFIMLAFGLGTVPALFLFGSAVQWISTALRQELLRWAGLMVVFVGCYNLYQHLKLAGWLD